MKRKLTLRLLLAAAPVLFVAGLHAQTTAPETVVLNADSLSKSKYIGYGRQDVKRITSSIATVTGKDIRPAFTNNIGLALQGRLAGLTVQPGSFEPGNNDADIFIRRDNTFGVGGAPLVIVDGFLSSYAQLVPEEIEEISVLKDAAATAIYGMRGANGVLLVTTRKGRNAPLAISATAQYGFQQATSLPKFLGAFQYASLFNEALQNDGRAPLYSPADLEAFRTGSDPVFHPDVNWYNEVLRKSAPLANYNLNFSGGNNSARYFVLLNALTSDGLIRNFGTDNEESSNARYSRYNFRANMDVSLSSRLTAQLNIGGSFEDKANAGDLYTGSTFSLIDRLPPNAFPVRNPNGSFGGNAAYSEGNPVGNLLNTGFSTSNGRTLQAAFRLTQKLDFLTQGLTASAAVSMNSFYIGSSTKRRAYQRFGISTNAVGDTVYSSFGQASSLNANEDVLSQYRNYAVQGFLNYDKTFGRNSISAMAMFNADNFTINKNYPNTNAANQDLPYKTNSAGTRLTFTNREKYIAEFIASYMGSENFAPGNRYGFFPAGSVGWIVSNEGFLANNRFITFLKLRASYGLTGNDFVGGQRFMFAQTYPFTSSYFFGTSNTPFSSYGEGRPANTDATWEKDKKANIGVELNLKERFTLVVDVFRNKRYDIIATANQVTPLLYGYSDMPFVNLGKVTSKGFEVAARYGNSEKNKLHFFTEAIAFYSKNTIDYNAEPIQANANLYRTGTPIGQPFGLVAMGLFQSDAEAQASARPAGINVRAGDIKYKDIGGPLGVPDGIIDGNDVTAIGKTSLPEWTGSLRTGLAYKGFDLDLVFQGVTGVTRYLGGARYFAFQNFGKASEIALDRWTPQNTDATYPRLSADNNQNNYRFSSFWQRDGSFIKLRSAELGYQLPAAVISRLRLAQARFYINGTNLFTLDKIKEGDVEALYGYPALRTLSVGLRVGL